MTKLVKESSVLPEVNEDRPHYKNSVVGVPTQEEVTAEAEKLLGSVNRTVEYLEENPDFPSKPKHHDPGLGHKPHDG